LLGCYAHKLNLAIKHWLGLGSSKGSQAYLGRTHVQIYRESVVTKVHNIVVLARSILHTAKLRELMEDDFVHPLLDQETRWTSIYTMITRFLRMENYLVQIRRILQIFPDEAEMIFLKDLQSQLNFLNSRMVLIQQDEMPLHSARVLYDEILIAFPEMQHHLGTDARIIVNRHFDNGIFKILDNQEINLTREEKVAVHRFQLLGNDGLETEAFPNVNITQNRNVGWRPPAGVSLNPKDTIEQANKRLKFVSQYDMDTLKCIPSTSCAVERLFSKCGLVQTKLRCAMSSAVFEARMVLLENKSYWRNDFYTSNKLSIRPKLKNGIGFQLVQSMLDSIRDAGIGENNFENDDIDVLNIDYETV
jgi:hypothetical protein